MMNRICKVAAVLLLGAILMPLTAGSQPDNVTLAKMAWGEARGESVLHQAATMWTVLNRVDDPRFPDSVYAVVTCPSQFTGYRMTNPADPELLALADDVLERWHAEHQHWKNVGRVLPRECVYFVHRNGQNVFGCDWPIRETIRPEDMEDDNPYEGQKEVEEIR